MSDVRKSMIVAVAAIAFLLVVAGLVLTPAPVTHADTVPTPVSAQAGSGSTGWQAITFWSADSVAASAGSNALQLPGYDSIDLQYVIDQPATVNTTTIKVQWSNDNTNWSDGPAIVSNNAADADSMVQIANMGRYTRLYATVSNTQTVTITAKGIAKP